LNRVSRRHHQNQSGFTLIELLVVIAVLAVLAGIVIFNVVGVTNRGKTSACDTDKATVQTAVDSDVADNKGDLTAGDMTTTGDLTTLKNDNYIHSIPSSCLTMTLAGSATAGYTVSVTYKP
jgi:prepilin-type N-terminal cleavage/methylation domain-containing protein